MRFDGLHASYNGRDVLKDLCVELPEAGSVCFFGPSGCGKTTLLRALSDRLTEAGIPTAWVFQEDRLLPNATAEQNVTLVGATHEQARELLCALGLEGEEHKRPGQLSGGMRRRVAIARALAFSAIHPGALILDEPFKGLDDEAKNQAAALIPRAGPPLCLLVTHDLEEAALLTARVLRVEGPPLTVKAE